MCRSLSVTQRGLFNDDCLAGIKTGSKKRKWMTLFSGTISLRISVRSSWTWRRELKEGPCKWLYHRPSTTGLTVLNIMPNFLFVYYGSISGDLQPICFYEEMLSAISKIFWDCTWEWNFQIWLVLAIINSIYWLSPSLGLACVFKAHRESHFEEVSADPWRLTYKSKFASWESWGTNPNHDLEVILIGYNSVPYLAFYRTSHDCILSQVL